MLYPIAGRIWAVRTGPRPLWLRLVLEPTLHAAGGGRGELSTPRRRDERRRGFEAARTSPYE